MDQVESKKHESMATGTSNNQFTVGGVVPLSSLVGRRKKRPYDDSYHQQLRNAKRIVRELGAGRQVEKYLEKMSPQELAEELPRLNIMYLEDAAWIAQDPGRPPTSGSDY